LRRLRLLHRHRIVAWIKLHKKIARVDNLVIVRMDSLDGTVNACCYGIQVAVHLGIVCVLVVAGV
jgi:hypothetical protein